MGVDVQGLDASANRIHEVVALELRQGSMRRRESDLRVLLRRNERDDDGGFSIHRERMGDILIQNRRGVDLIVFLRGLQ